MRYSNNRAGMNHINFRDFFQERYFQVDRKYVDISMPRHLLSEMAERLDIAKRPIKIDQEDISFLQQFPPHYWRQAIHERYNIDLKEGLKERQARRDPIEKSLRAVLERSLMDGDYGTLRNKVSEELFEKLMDGMYAHVQNNESLAKSAAEDIAEKETEKKFPHIVYPPTEEGLLPGFRKYTFKKERRSKDFVYIAAKPYINRLVHKLERTRDQEHHPESGLKELNITHGQYGYDLYGIKEGPKVATGSEDKEDQPVTPHSARGFQFPTEDEIGRRLSDFLNHNSHRMYGDIAEDGDVVWKPVGDGRTMYKDNWAWKRIYNRLFSIWMSKLQTAEPGSYTLPSGDAVPPEKGFKNMSKLRAAAHLLAKAEVIEMAEEGKIHGAPIPGIASDGMPVTVKETKKGKQLDAPPLYLPHKKMAVRIQTPHGFTTEMREIPLVNPTEYLRMLGIEEGDEDLDETLLRGYNKDYVVVPHSHYKKAPGYLAGGAFHVTQNSGGRMYLDPSDPEYEERREEIDASMGMTSLNDYNQPVGGPDSESGEYFYDIIKGIWNCIKSACGGMTSHEIDIMKQSVPDLHQMVYQKLMMNLRDPKLDSAAGRRNFAKNVASSWAQQDLGSGGGTRRLRRLTQDARDESLDATTQGSGSGELSLRDAIQMRAKDKRSAGSSKLRQGEKIRPTGQHQFSYHIDNLRIIIASMENEAEQIDTNRDSAIKLSRQEISDQIADMIGNAITDKAALIFQLQYYLTQLFRAVGLTQQEAENRAEERLAEYTAGGKSKAKQIVAAFKADQVVQQILSQPDENLSGLSLSAQDAVEKLRVILQQLPPEKLHDKNTQQLIYKYIEDSVAPVDKAVVRAEADKAFGKTPTVVQQPQRQPGMSAQARQDEEVNALIRAKNWLGVAKNPYFLRIAVPKALTALIAKLEAAMQPLQPNTVDHEDYGFAIAHLKILLRKRQQAPGIVDIQ